MLKSFSLTPAEKKLLDIAQAEYEAQTLAAQKLLTERLGAIYLSHDLGLETEGHFQRDPLDPESVRFLYEDGVPAPATEPTELHEPATP